MAARKKTTRKKTARKTTKKAPARKTAAKKATRKRAAGGKIDTGDIKKRNERMDGLTVDLSDPSWEGEAQISGRK